MSDVLDKLPTDVVELRLKLTRAEMGHLRARSSREAGSLAEWARDRLGLASDLRSEHARPVTP